MKIAAMLSLFLLVSLPGTRCGSFALQQEDAKSAELEEASKLSGQVVFLFSESKFDEALALAKQALEIREKILGRDHETVASSLDSIADIYAAQQKYVVAEPLYRRSLTILEKKWGPESKHLTSTIESLALVRFALRDSGGAEKLYLRSLAIKEKMLGPSHPSLAEPLYNCACALFAGNKPSEAREYQLRADRMTDAPAPVKRGFVLQGSAILRVEPEYPLQARRDRVSGQVIVEVKVDECGRVIDARAVKGHLQLVEGAINAARQWRFTRSRVAGRPVRVIGTITFKFHI